jgi:mRNA-degrading endonuclease HigB of HigAB toxin-antitoxin module
MTNAQMTRKERIEARRAYFAKQEKPFGNCSVPIQVHVEYDVKIEPVSGIGSKERNDELTTTPEAPPRPSTIGERVRLLQNSNIPTTTTSTTTTPVMASSEPQKPDTIYHAISIKNIDGCESREDVYRFIILHCPYKIKTIYVSEIMKHAFVDFFVDDHANDMIKRLDRYPFHNYMLEVQRIGV